LFVTHWYTNLRYFHTQSCQGPPLIAIEYRYPLILDVLLRILKKWAL